MITYTATFSNGQTVTRNTKHPYQYAVGLINKQTNQLRNVKFTANKPTPDWRGVASTTKASGYGISQKDVAQWNREALAERENWIVEIVVPTMI